MEKYAEIKINNSIVGNVYAHVRYDNQKCEANNFYNQHRRAGTNGFIATLDNIEILDLVKNGVYYTYKNINMLPNLALFIKQLENEAFATPATVKKGTQTTNQITYYKFKDINAAKKYFNIP